MLSLNWFVRGGWAVASLAVAGACDVEPDTIRVELAPSVVSSLDGSVHVHTTVLAEGELEPDAPVAIAVDYTDRNGDAHSIAGADGVTDELGAFDAVLTGLDFEGVGTVTASIGELTGTATFSVLDLTPPVVTILPPNPDLEITVGQDVAIDVEVSDEIGISEVLLEADGDVRRDRRTVVASGAASTTVTFDIRAEDTAAGGTVTLHALAGDLSGNLTAAEPITLTVIPSN